LTVIPQYVREAAGIQLGDSLLWEVRDDGVIQVRARKSKTETLYSLNRQVWGTYESAAEYLKKEKQSWE
jgi:bifunctional DNA-binding transcriptional regulator/antitoxin component of YhaV-PrlF toxin-antitoxin module